ncbi:hypothetical protein PRIPAC_88621 [Pristionchus pacificus]|uniref:Uncharacterized protein n=1 Tax=Pristionchus pacificus TaxID=54126 RepID=A0A454XY97_PRIPA|nr:hypothetical protein PRIPAC_88621 [Pristionchus pacificus]|eukprot:PDM82152.1 hypothetical protein PRIPAC_36545 [Pristionchus pacificus]
MTRSTILVGLCLLGAASAHFLAHTHSIAKSPQSKPNYPGPACTADDQAKTKTCLDSYFAAYGIDTTNGAPEFLYFMDLTNSVIQQYGTSGFDIYCDFETTLETCLGSLMTTPCMNSEAFTKMYGMNETEAVNYATSYAVEAYTCQNLEITKQYYPCIATHQDDIAPAIIDCTKKMMAEFEGATDVCVPYDHYITCLENHYVDFCDEGIRSYICSTEEIAINFTMNGQCAASLHKC